MQPVNLPEALAHLRGRLAALREQVEELAKTVNELEGIIGVPELDARPKAPRTHRGRNGHPTESGADKLALSSSVRMKYALFRNALLAAGKPLKSTELMELVPQLSRSYVYHLVGDMKKRGELQEYKDGRFSLREINSSAVESRTA